MEFEFVGKREESRQEYVFVGRRKIMKRGISAGTCWYSYRYCNLVPGTDRYVRYTVMYVPVVSSSTSMRTVRSTTS